MNYVTQNLALKYKKLTINVQSCKSCIKYYKKGGILLVMLIFLQQKKNYMTN